MKKLGKFTTVVVMMLVTLFAFQACSLFCAKERKRKELAKIVEKMNREKSSLGDNIDSDMFFEIGDITSCMIEGDAVVLEFRLIDDAISIKNFTRDAQLFSFAVMYKNKAGTISEKVAEDLRIAEYNLVYRYIDKENNILDFKLSPDELTQIIENPDEVINSVNRNNVIYTITKNEEAGLRPLLDDDSEISIVDVSIDDKYEIVTLTYNVPNDGMEYVSIEAIKRGVSLAYQDTEDMLIAQSKYVLKELGLDGIKIVIKNHFGFVKETVLTWNEIESNKVSDEDIISAQRQTVIEAYNREQKAEIGKDGIINGWVEERGNYIATVYVFDGVNSSIDNIESLYEVKQAFISSMNNAEGAAEIAGLKELGFEGIKFVYKDKGQSGEKSITIKFEEMN